MSRKRAVNVGTDDPLRSQRPGRAHNSDVLTNLAHQLIETITDRTLEIFSANIYNFLCDLHGSGCDLRAEPLTQKRRHTHF